MTDVAGKMTDVERIVAFVDALATDTSLVACNMKINKFRIIQSFPPSNEEKFSVELEYTTLDNIRRVGIAPTDAVRYIAAEFKRLTTSTLCNAGFSIGAGLEYGTWLDEHSAQCAAKCTAEHAAQKAYHC